MGRARWALAGAAGPGRRRREEARAVALQVAMPGAEETAAEGGEDEAAGAGRRGGKAGGGTRPSAAAGGSRAAALQVARRGLVRPDPRQSRKGEEEIEGLNSIN